MSWIPLSSGVIKSSLWAEEDWVIKIFLTMLAGKGPGDIYTDSAYALAHDSRKTEEQVLKALEILQGPDRLRREQQKDGGARIRKVEGGWLIINAAEYRKRMSEELKRYRNAKAQKAWRDKQASVKRKPISAKNYAPPSYEAADGRGDFNKSDSILGESLPASAGITKSAGVDDDEQPGFAPLE